MGTAAYLPQFGDCVTIVGVYWQVQASEIVSVEPAALELRDYLRSIEGEYLHQRSRLEQIVARDAGKAPLVRRKLEKLRKYMDELLKDL